MNTFKALDEDTKVVRTTGFRVLSQRTSGELTDFQLKKTKRNHCRPYGGVVVNSSLIESSLL